MKEENLNRKILLEKRRELLASLKYASFIQKAVLPGKHLLQNCLKDYFILHKPRDIVSGDFYYCSRKDGKIIVAAGDCTGHGVPGALMSIMGISFLNEILNSGGSAKPSRILNLLRERVMNALHQTGEELENKDAIDMALCVYDPESRELQYAGAQNPIYVVSKKKLIEIKADKMPVGVHAIEEESFSNHCLQLIPGDTVYLFSDGFADQFGGPVNKKFKYGPFKELLKKIAESKMDKQQEILDRTITEWKGEEPQVDDILVFGIRFE